jgi:glucose/arabinose dehydrogenase
MNTTRRAAGLRAALVCVAALLVLVATPLAVAGSSPSPVDPSGPAQPLFQPGSVEITLVPFADGLEEPVFVTGDGTGSGALFAVEQPGRIRAISPDGTLRPVPFLNISDRIQAGGEQGLLGLAFHPGYAANGRFFVDYTRLGDGATVISEFRAVDGVASAGSERVLLVIAQPYPNHNGGMIAFDSAGMLLIGMGDGGGGGDPDGNGQNRDALLGKLLRIDVDGREPYGIPTDNPFLRSADTRPEIWTLGMRNPWRFSVDRVTGDVFIGDVGQGDWEELDIVPAGTAGQNFGWNSTEGPDCYGARTCDTGGLTPPVWSVSHGEGDCSIVGGYVYRGTAQPGLVGAYLFGDYCTGVVRILSAVQAVASGTAAVSAVATLEGTLVSFGQGDDGELYVVDHGGRILHIVASPPS